MKRLVAFAMLVVLVLVIAAIPAVSAQTGPQQRYVINFRNSGIPSDLEQTVGNAGGQLVRTLPEVGIAVAVSSNPAFADTLGGLNSVQSVGPLPYYSLPQTQIVQPALDAPTVADDLYNGGLLWGINRVRADVAWAAGYSGSHNTVVAVIDTGIASNHPDLAPNLVFAACFASTPTCNPYPSLSYHGTHVAGTVAAAFGSGRVVGVGPNLGLASYNTFEVIPDCGVCSYSDSRWAAMIDAASRGFEVINMSLGGLGVFGGQGTNELAAYRQAENRVANYVQSLGTVMVASAGNEELDLNGPIMHFPGDVPGIISVAATGIRPDPIYPQDGAFDVIAFYSNFGAPVTVSAPGGDCGPTEVCSTPNYLILSTYVVANPTCAATQSCAVGYAWTGGTSMASPHVAGVVGLLRDANPGLRPNQVEATIKRTAENLGDRQLFGHGMVDAAAALGVD